MNSQTILRATSVLALCLAASACSDDDDKAPALETGLGALGPSAPEDAGADPTDEMGATGEVSGAMGDVSGAMAEPSADMTAGEANADAATASADMSFFATSEASTTGGNLGGLAGADERCQTLAEAAGAGDKTWRAYLSVDDDGTGASVNAIERIGDGPWMNFNGDVIATDVDNLLDPANIFNGEPNLILTELGVVVPVLEHDILTGTLADGTVAPGLNCENWTSDSADLIENPQVGHSDIPGNINFSPLWDGAHVSANCSQEGLAARGGSGRLYCFAE